MEKKYIWLFGENLGETHNNNSFYFWEHIVLNEDRIRKYFVLTKNKKNVEFVNTIGKDKRKYIVWKNSVAHMYLYDIADMMFVTLSYRDTQPEKILGKDIKLQNRKPIVYLQHGTLAIKSIGYKGDSYNNNLYKFVYYNKNIKSGLVEKNKMKPYQLYYGEYLPRYKELCRLNEEKQCDEKSIFWFITWREYLDNEFKRRKFVNNIKSVIKDDKLQKYLEKHEMKLKICTHMFLVDEVEKLLDGLGICKNIEIISQKNTDIMREIVNAELLISDYSSVIFDFTSLSKPVILYQNDLDEYLKKRKIYCEKEELEQHNVATKEELLDTIINEKYSINEFCSSRVSPIENVEYVKSGGHIDKMYADFKQQQENKIAFVGYNFFGIGGTVNATLGLAEELLAKNYLVELVSLKKIKPKVTFPYGLTVKNFSNPKSKSRKERLLNKIIIGRKHLKMLRKDANVDLLEPISGFRLKRFMGNTNAHTVFSTRESIHKMLYKAKSKDIEKKGYFFHCPETIMEDIFPGVMEEIAELNIENAIYVTDKNKEAIEERYKYSNYDNSLVIGNALQSNKYLSEVEIKDLLEVADVLEEVDSDEQIFECLYLVRISKERQDDIENMLGFARYLKEKKITNVRIKLYGTGDMVNELYDVIFSEELEDIVMHMGVTSNIKKVMREAHCVTDFSMNHSFGMTYIEAILNGKMIFCERNVGSLEVLRDIEGVFFESYADLVEKIYGLENCGSGYILENYKKIKNRYSSDVVKKLIEGMNL